MLLTRAWGKYSQRRPDGDEQDGFVAHGVRPPVRRWRSRSRTGHPVRAPVRWSWRPRRVPESSLMNRGSTGEMTVAANCRMNGMAAMAIRAEEVPAQRSPANRPPAPAPRRGRARSGTAKDDGAGQEHQGAGDEEGRPVAVAVGDGAAEDRAGGGPANVAICSSSPTLEARRRRGTKATTRTVMAACAVMAPVAGAGRRGHERSAPGPWRR